MKQFRIYPIQMSSKHLVWLYDILLLPRFLQRQQEAMLLRTILVQGMKTLMVRRNVIQIYIMEMMMKT